MRVLIACERSGIVRDAFLARGHDAMSCDLEPSDRPGPHHTGDVWPLLGIRWDLVIAHPPCTYLANSGALRLYRGGKKANGRDIDRWEAMARAGALFRACRAANAPRVAIENPVMHSYGKRACGIDKPSFTIQPWQFGHPEKKRTCFWTRGLPPLTPTNVIPKHERSERLSNLPPGPDRQRQRSETFQGIAEAMASQWGDAI